VISLPPRLADEIFSLQVGLPSWQRVEGLEFHEGESIHVPRMDIY